MKKMKKLLSLVLAMMLVLAMGSTVVAAQPTSGNNQTQRGKLTVENAIPGQTYTIYKILDLESYNSDNGAYLYKIATGWEDFVNGEVGSKYLSVDADGYVTWKTDVPETDAAEFAKAALAYVEGKNLAVKAATAGEAPEGSDTVTVVFDDLDLGYYLLDSTTGALCSLDTTNPERKIEEKNEIPEVKKEVEEDSTNNFGQENTADVGETVNYQATITTKAGVQNYKLHDTMSAGLTFNPESVGVTLDEAPVGDANYTVVTTGLTDGCTFEVAFEEAFLNTLQPNQSIVITYSATVNENAVIGKDGNTNKVVLEYGDGNKTEEGPEQTTTTYVYNVDIYKYTGELPDGTPLAGAEFELRRQSATGDAIQFVKTGDNAYRVATPAEIADNSIEKLPRITTDTTGKFNLSGLDVDTYYLKETKAPDGYNLLKEDLVFEISQDADKNGTITVAGEQTDVVNVLNNTGAELPSTGGIGTTIFYVLGGILVVGAGILLVVKKRMSSEK